MKQSCCVIQLFICALCAQVASAQQGSFLSEEESVAGWYHSHDLETWVGKGAELEVLTDILERVSQSEGEKRHADMVDTQIAFGPGNWSYEWIQAGDAALAQANRMSGEDKLQKFRAALTYYTTGSWPHLGRSDDLQALEKSVSTYMQAGQLMNVPVRHVDISVGETSVKGYLHAPVGDGPFPFVINSFGSDVTKEDSFDLFYRELEPLGIGMLAVDMPGIGEARELSMADGSDSVMEGALNFLNQQDSVDKGSIFIVGGSFGGNAAARAFYRLEVAGVVSMCGPLHSAFVAPAVVLDNLPMLTIDGVKSRFKVLDQATEVLTELMPQTSLKVQGLMVPENEVNTPLLVITTNRDPVAPLDDLYDFLATSTNHSSVILDIEGHCPPRWVREPIIARWLSDKIAEQHVNK
jgi:esterase FrsA